MSALAALVAFVAACLAATVAFELRPLPQAPSALPRPAAAAPADATQSVPAPADRTSLVAALLARPLFSATRRPSTAAAPAAIADSALPLPRMSGILIDGARRSVIFSAPPGGKPVIVGEGGRVGPFTVETIGAQQVVVAGPDGRRTLRTSFDPNLPPPNPVALPPLVAPQFPGIAVPGAPPTGAPDPAAGFAPPPQAGAAR